MKHQRKPWLHLYHLSNQNSDGVMKEHSTSKSLPGSQTAPLRRRIYQATGNSTFLKQFECQFPRQRKATIGTPKHIDITTKKQNIVWPKEKNIQGSQRILAGSFIQVHRQKLGFSSLECWKGGGQCDPTLSNRLGG